MFPNPKTIPPVFVPPPSRRLDEAAVATQGATCNIMPSNTAEDHHIHARTPLEFSLPSDDTHRPYKRTKTVLTTVSVGEETESDDLRSLRIYQLARTTRDTFAAQANYRRLRVCEIDAMREIAQAEVEEAEVLLKNANLQMDEVKRDVCSSSHAFTKENLDKLASAYPPPTVPEFPELAPHDNGSGRNTPTSYIGSEDWDE